MLTKEQILSADDRKTITVEVPEWGGDVTLSEMSAASRDAYEQSMYVAYKKDEPVVNMRASLVAACLVDEDGNRMFSVEDVDTLGGMSGYVLGVLFDKCQELNALRDEDVDDLAKNS